MTSTSTAVTRAKRDEQAAIKKAERISHIAGMMARQEWERGVTGVSLAALWGVKVNTVEHYASEASRRTIAFASADEVKLVASHYLSKRAQEVDEQTTRRPNDVYRKAEVTAKVLEPWARIVGVSGLTNQPIETALPEAVRTARDLAETGDARGLAVVRAYAELEVLTVDAAARERARRLKEDWMLLSDEARADVRKTLEGLR